tara:strand:+ start:115 stop:1023 length:909 start_codon:yes stop_codon:yes gene_type:complete
MPKKKPLYAPMLATFGGGSIQGFKSGEVIDAVGLTSSSPASIAEMYTANNPDGVYYTTVSGYNGGNAFPVRYAKYNSKGWIEVFISVVSDGGGDERFTYQSGSDYWLTSANLSNNGINYSTSTVSCIALGSQFNATDVAITSKSSRSANGVAATGANQNSALPLVASNDLSGSQKSTVITKLGDYFCGESEGFSSGVISGQNYNVGWYKDSKYYLILLNNRNSSPQTDHWMIADGVSNTGGTYQANIGYRGGSASTRSSPSSYHSAYVGAWEDWAVDAPTSIRDSQYDIDTGNVLSIWLTNM